MSGFDTSQFIKREAARPELAPDPSQSVAAPPPDATRSLQQSSVEETAEKPRKRVKRARGVAGVATVAALEPGVSYFAELNRMFDYPIPPVFRGQRWRELCEDVRHFAATGKLQQALDMGWLLVELIGAPNEPWRRPPRYPGLAAESVVFFLRGRPVGKVEPHRIEILDHGRHPMLYRAHHMSNRAGCEPMWDVFDPRYWPNIGTEDRIYK